MTARTKKLVQRKSGIILDISFGGTPQERSVSLGPTGDIRHDPRKLPFPLPDSCVNTAVIMHVLEYVPQPLFFKWWDEVWRVMQPKGIVHVSGPYGGDESHGWISDPTHLTRVIEQSFAWLDPRTPMYSLHGNLGRPTPKPWFPAATARVPGTEGSISYNVTLIKAPVEKKASAARKRGGR